MRTKARDFVLFMSARVYDIIVITETWLHDKIDSAEYFDKFYNVYRHDRCHTSSVKQKGGGVLIAVRADYKSELISLQHTDLIEQICIKLSFANNYAIFIFNSYIPPKSNFSIYRYHLENIQKIIDDIDVNHFVLIFGDFNLPNITWKLEDNILLPFDITDDIDEYVTGFFLSNDFKQFNSHKNDIGKTLDLIFSNDLLKASCNLSANPVSINTVHHKALDFIFEFFSYEKELLVQTFKYNFNKADFDGLNNYLEKVDWSSGPTSNDPEVMYVFICDHFDKAISLYVPEFEPRWGNKPPWFNSRLCNMRNTKNKAYKKFRLSGSENDKAQFVLARQEFNFFRNFLYRQYIFNIENKIKSDSAAFWHYLNSKRDNNNIPSRLHYNSMISENAVESCDLFSKFFQSTFVKPSSTTSNTQHSCSPIREISFNITMDDVVVAINSLKNETVCSVGAYPSLFFKKCLTNVVTSITMLFNSCLENGRFLDCWKHCSIVPIFKSGDRSQVTNYRPIVKQSTFAKIFDIIIKDKLFERVEHLISPCQHGFVPGRSTATNLILKTNNIIKAMEQGSQCDVIYTDFAKAFDTVDHNFLLDKLKNIGLSSNLLTFFKHFLLNRKLRVQIKNACSSYSINAYSGIPQGTHIGPLLFIIFINEVPLIVNFSKCLMFADDLKLIARISNLDDCLKLQSDLTNLAKWCSENGININISKCCVSSYTYNSTKFVFSYSISDTPLKRATEVTDLGVTFDEKLRFSAHIDRVVSKAYCLLGFIRRNSKDFRDAYTLKSLYVSLVRSTLEYCSIIWSPYYSIHSNRIERIQKIFTKTALRLNWHSELPSYESRRKLLGLQALSDRRTCFFITFAYNVISGKIKSPEICDFFTFYRPPRDLRNNRNFTEVVHRTNYAENEPIARCLHLCNSFTPPLNFNVNCDIFKLNLFKYYN